jgi:hypothetical protein
MHTTEDSGEREGEFHQTDLELKPRLPECIERELSSVTRLK